MHRIYIENKETNRDITQQYKIKYFKNLNYSV